MKASSRLGRTSLMTTCSSLIVETEDFTEDPTTQGALPIDLTNRQAGQYIADRAGTEP